MSDINIAHFSDPHVKASTNLLVKPRPGSTNLDPETFKAAINIAEKQKREAFAAVTRGRMSKKGREREREKERERASERERNIGEKEYSNGAAEGAGPRKRAQTTEMCLGLVIMASRGTLSLGR